MVAADTRISSGYNILSRSHSKTSRLTDKCLITSAGMVADVETLHKNLETRIKQYRMQNKRDPSTESIA
jgi:20S proteasome subunit beta 6